VTRGKKKKNSQTTEDEQLQAFIDTLIPRQPKIKIYRIESDKRQTPMGVFNLDELSGSSVEQRIADTCGAGTFLVRTIRSNGRYGPSRVVAIDPGAVRHVTGD